MFKKGCEVWFVTEDGIYTKKRIVQGMITDIKEENYEITTEDMKIYMIKADKMSFVPEDLVSQIQ